MFYFHVHTTPLFTNCTNRSRSRSGVFGDNVEELDDSIWQIMATLEATCAANDTLVFMTLNNGPYHEEGWAQSGRTNLQGYCKGTAEPCRRHAGHGS